MIVTRRVPEEWGTLLEDAGFGSIRSLAIASGVSQPAVSRLIFGTGRTSDETIASVAAALGVPPTTVFHLSGTSVTALGPYEPPSVSQRLSVAQRRALDALIRTMVDDE
ncbi:helix-turn-helix domain-containing protein [Arthrobacter woluwensis]|uniref:helix-turn-helix domain-containing protein n=1 Tax=Arthrobacter woluwensis TaxID=156980 RepID=UPI001114BB8A